METLYNNSSRLEESMKKNVYIFGAGFQGIIVYEILMNSQEYNILAFVDDYKYNQSINGIPILSRNEVSKSHPIVIALGNDDINKIEIKKQLCRTLENPIINIFDKSCIISPSLSIGKGNIFHPGTIIMNSCIFKNYIIVSTGASVDHNNTIEDYVNICPGVITAGNVHIKEGAFLGTGCIILPNITIGEYAIVGAGAVVIKDVKPHTTVIGIPAKEMNNVNT